MMIEIAVLDSSSNQSSSFLPRRFPVIVGHSANSEVLLTAPGVWERHAEIHLDHAQGFVLRTCGDALTRVNGKPCQQAVLRNGDLLEVGGAKLRFWLRSTSQRKFRAREIATWIALGLLAAGQIALISLLPN